MNPNVTSLSDVCELFAGDQTSRRWALAMVRSAHHHQRLPMFVVCAQAPGRIDGVLVVLVVEVLITAPFGLLADACGARSIARLACGMAASSALRRHRKKSWTILLDRSLERCKGCWEISFSGRGRCLRGADERYIACYRALERAKHRPQFGLLPLPCGPRRERLRQHAYRP